MNAEQLYNEVNKCLGELGNGLAVFDILQRLFDDGSITCEEDSILRMVAIGAKVIEEARNHLDETLTTFTSSANQMELPASTDEGEGLEA